MSTDSGTPVFTSRAEESRFLRLRLERAEREAAALRADRDALAAALRNIAGRNTWNECATLSPQVRQTKADISNAIDEIIYLARQALSPHGGNNG